ncbi:hypothetical protein D3C80_1833660 [compost metagenome]
MSIPGSRKVNKVSLSHPTVLLKLRDALEKASTMAAKSPKGIVVVDVYNSKDKLFLSVCGVRNKGCRVCDSEGIDVTDLIKRVLENQES